MTGSTPTLVQGLIILYLSLSISKSGLRDPLSCSILGSGVPCTDQRLKDHYSLSLYFIVAELSLPLRTRISILLPISIPHLLPLPLSDPFPIPFPIFRHFLLQAREIQPRLFPPPIGYPWSRPPLHLQNNFKNSPRFNVLRDRILLSGDLILRCLRACLPQGIF